MTYPVISLKPSYNSVIRGCPGLPDTLPRIECQLRVRSNDSLPFKLVKIETVLKTIEMYFNRNLYGSNNNSFTPFNRTSDSPNGNSDTNNQNITVHYRKKIVLSHPTDDNGEFDDNLIGIDIPLTIGLPDDIKETNYNSNFGKTQTFLDCTVFYTDAAGGSSNKKRNFFYPVNVERYTYIPSPSYFRPIGGSNVLSPDQKFLISYSIENPCVSMDNDTLKLSISIKLNPFPNNAITTSSPNELEVSTPTIFSTKKKFKSKVKLKSITTQVLEYLEILKKKSEFSSAQTSNILQSSVRQVDQIISLNSMTFQFSLKIFTKENFLQSFESSDSGCPKTKLLINRIDDIPLRYHSSITTIGQHFNVSHSLSIRFKFNKSLKNFEINHPLVISFWSIDQLPLIENLVSQERQTAKFAKKFYKNFGRIKNVGNDSNSSNCLEYPSLPPIIYNFNDPETNNRFNILYSQKDASRVDPSKLKRVPVIQ
ncbi:hypothetical protein SMKI_16G1090 [Saccharomyces mikatae IFO 1815]|uniref:Uncharacterized protein n=1 Tax=Saccharomyces mikatae IFO 1815 TaxID=226126 RepID=A0AA35NDL8_SACMI|nr:uncharacterized protein SMKI_16G1090 [Saccharomyces mikatae IFO 1815]CAI4036811.1 hypothetical protein SMKI_16G1090 [Saccharomyces mikatae IFO 1815]